MADGMVATFTEHEVDICLEQAATLRRSYLGLNCEEFPEYADQMADARAFDDLARKLAPLAGIELERQCGYCEDGVSVFSDRKCCACLGTGLLPPVGW